MKRFFILSLAYLFVAMAVLYIFRENPGYQIWDALRRTAKTLINFVHYLPYLIGGFIVIFLTSRQFLSRETAREVGWAFGGCLVFSAAFTFMKTSLPYVVPFYADPFFADLDKLMHGGIDPWVLTHAVADYLNADAVSFIYFFVWGLPAAFFPIIIAMCDHDKERKARFMILFVFVWIGLGNVMAYAGASVGPVYYDLLLGTERFTDLTLALETSGVKDSHLGMVQNGLWKVYVDYGQMVGSGITAFPSVHNGVATLTMLYLWERSRWLAPVGISFCAVILFLSVYVGWHYALDGYASILLVTGAWWVLHKRDSRASSAAKAQQTPEREAALA